MVVEPDHINIHCNIKISVVHKSSEIQVQKHIKTKVLGNFRIGIYNVDVINRWMNTVGKQGENIEAVENISEI